MPFGNVNVKYSPCKSAGQLKSAEQYMLGKKREQLRDGVVKTEPDLYAALGCNRDNFARSILVTRKLHGKSYSRMKPNNILAHKMSVSFHPDDSDRMSYKTAYDIAAEFAERFMRSKGFEVLFAVHTDSEHIHVHFLISNCNMNDGKSYRRNKRDLYEMSEFFGEQCLRYGLVNSVRGEYYNRDLNKSRDKLTFAEYQMRERGAESFKDELREVINIELSDPDNKCFDDVIKALWEHYNVEARVAGNTVSYRHPEYRDKNGNPVSVRGAKLGDLYTRKGIEHEYSKKSGARADKSINAAGRNKPSVEPYCFDEITGTAGSGGQIPNGSALCDIGANLRGIDEFYERYRESVKPDERQSTGITQPSGQLSAKRKGRSR